MGQRRRAESADAPPGYERGLADDGTQNAD